MRYLPAERHRGRYENEVFTRRANAVGSPDDLSGKAALRQALAYRASPDITEKFRGILDPGTSEETIRGAQKCTSPSTRASAASS
ncbi:MAG: hypothetical protein MPN21_05760 [Thermoanaerobaculia bacterium]|nr:hypothetical protein [Thermoanaerobaculia bacterium]